MPFGHSLQSTILTIPFSLPRALRYATLAPHSVSHLLAQNVQVELISGHSERWGGAAFEDQPISPRLYEPAAVLGEIRGRGWLARCSITRSACRIRVAAFPAIYRTLHRGRDSNTAMESVIDHRFQRNGQERGSAWRGGSNGSLHGRAAVLR